MQKIISIILICCMLLAVLASCGEKKNAETTEVQKTTEAVTEEAIKTAEPITGEKVEDTDAIVAGFQTVGDVIDCEGAESDQHGAMGEVFIYVFELNGVYYRTISNLTKEQTDAYYGLDFSDPDHDSKEKEMISLFKIDRLDNLSEMALSEEEMQALVGKTGKDLLDAGWTTGSYDLETMEFWMEYTPFTYTVVLDGLEIGDDFDIESFDQEEAIRTLTVKSVTLSGLGDATNLE